MSVEFVALTNTGQKRQVNEDSLWPQSSRHGHEFDTANGLLFVIADGMGGHGAGDIASKLAITEIAEKYYTFGPEVSDVSQRLELAIRSAHELVRTIAAQSSETEQMGTTVVAAVVKFDETNFRGEAWLAWVGDSRIYLQRAGKLRQLSRDHSRLWPLIEAGQITWDEVKLHPDRSKITNALVAQQAETSVEFLRLGLEAGDMLLLCSDGLSGEVRPAAIEQTLAAFPPVQAASRLIDLANAPTEINAEGQAMSMDGGNDNISLILVKMPVDQTKTQPLATTAPGARPLPAGAPSSSGGKSSRLGLLVIVGLLLLVGVVGVALVLVRSDGAIFATTPNVAMITPTVQPTVQPALTETAILAQKAVIVAVDAGSAQPPASDTSPATAVGQLVEKAGAETRQPTVTRGPIQTPTAPPTATSTPLPLPTATATAQVTATTVVTLDISSLPPPLLLEPEADESGKVSRDSTQETRFVWQWPHELPADLGFEVMVWLKGKEPTGAYDARLLQEAASYRKLSGNRYTVSLVLEGANGVTTSSADYVWTVAIVRLEPEYEWLGILAEPRPISLVVPGVSQ